MTHDLPSQNRRTPRERAALRRYARAAAGALLAAALLGLTAACGGGEEPAAAPMPAPTEQPDSSTVVMPEPEPEMPEPDPMPPAEEPAAKVTVTPTLSSSTISEGESIVLTLTASAPLDEEAEFTLAATPGIAFGEAGTGQPISTTPPQARTVAIPAGAREIAMTLTAMEIEDEDADGLDAMITIAASSEDITLNTSSLSLRVVNIAAVTLLDPVLITEDGLQVVLSASVARRMDAKVTVVVELPEGLFESRFATIVIPAGELQGTLMLSAASPVAGGTGLSFQIDSVTGSLAARAATADDGTAHSVTVEVDRSPPPSSSSNSSTSSSSSSSPPATSSSNNSGASRIRLTVTPDATQVDEGGLINLNIGLSQVTANDIILDLSAPADLVLGERVITIPQGESQARAQLQAGLVEQDTTATLRITPRGSCCTPSALSVDVRVLDVAGGLIVVSAPAAITEGATGEQLTFTLNRALTATVQVRVTQSSPRLLVGAAFASGQTAMVTIPANTQSVSLALETESVREDLTARLGFELLTSGVPACCAFSRDSLEIEVRNAERLRVKLPYPPVFDEGTYVSADITLTPPLPREHPWFNAWLSLIAPQSDGNGVLASGGGRIFPGETDWSINLTVGFSTGTKHTRLEVEIGILGGLGTLQNEPLLDGYTVEGDFDLTVREVAPTPRIRVEFEKDTIGRGESNRVTFTLLEPFPSRFSTSGLVLLGTGDSFYQYAIDSANLQAGSPVSASAFPLFQDELSFAPLDAPVVLRLSSGFPNCCHFEGDLEFTVLPKTVVTPSLLFNSVESATLTLSLDRRHTEDIRIEVEVASNPIVPGIGTNTVVTILAGQLSTALPVALNGIFDREYEVSLEFSLLTRNCCTLTNTHLLIRVETAPEPIFIHSRSFVHGTFDTSDVINQNIRSGVTEFGTDQQPFLQGYAAVTSLYLDWLYNARPVPGRSLTGPGFVTADNIDDIPANAAGYRTAREDNDIALSFVHHGAFTNSWWKTMNDAIGLAAGNLGVNVTIAMPALDGDTNQVEGILRRAAGDNADGYAVTISSRDAEGEAAPGYKAAINALLDIAPVVAFNACSGPTADGIDYLTCIGQTDYQAGYLGGQRLAREAAAAGLENPLAICFSQTVGLANLDARCDGFIDAMEEAGIDLAGTNGVLDVGTDEMQATETMNTFFGSNPGANVFFTLGPQVANSFYDFLGEQGLENTASETAFLHGTFDNNNNIVNNIRNGSTLFRIDQQQPLQGYGAVMALALRHRFGITPATPLTLTGPALVEADTVDAPPTRWWRGMAGASGGNSLTAEQVREQAGALRFIAIQHAECQYDAFWCTVQEGIRQAAEDTGVNVEIRAPEASQNALERLPQLIQTAIDESPTAILLTYTFPDSTAFTAAVDAANAAGIPVIAYNAGNGRLEDGNRYLTVYNQDEEEAGRQAAKRLIAAFEDNQFHPIGVCINSAVGNRSTDSRCAGFNEVFANTAGASVIGDGVLQTSDDATASQETISNYLSANPCVNVILTVGPNGAAPFYNFLEANPSASPRGCILVTPSLSHSAIGAGSSTTLTLTHPNTFFGPDIQVEVTAPELLGKSGAVVTIPAGQGSAELRLAASQSLSRGTIAQLEFRLLTPNCCLLDNSELELRVEDRIDAIIERGRLVCGVQSGTPGFGTLARDGFDADYCRAIAAAIFGTVSEGAGGTLEFVNATGSNRFELLADGSIDVLVRTTTQTSGRDSNLGAAFTATTFYDSAGILASPSLAAGFNSPLDLDGATFCALSGTSTLGAIQDFADANMISISQITAEGRDQIRQQFESGACNAYASDRSLLAGFRSALTAETVTNSVILSDAQLAGLELAKEPLGPAVHESGGFGWFDLVQWVNYGLITAEEESIMQNNLDSKIALGADGLSRTAARLLGLSGGGSGGTSKLASGAQFMQDVIRAVGNYGEIYERNLGSGGLGLERACTAQALWLTTDRSSWRDCDGDGTITQEENRGLMYAPRYDGSSPLPGNAFAAPVVNRLDAIIERGRLICGVQSRTPGFGTLARDGFDADYCRAIAAAIFGTVSEGAGGTLEFVNATGSNRFELLANGSIDVLVRTTTQTSGRDVTLGAAFTDTTFYDGAGILVSPARANGFTSPLDLDGATFCTFFGAFALIPIQEFASENNISITSIAANSYDQLLQHFQSGACDAYASDRSQLAVFRSDLTGEMANSVILSDAQLAGLDLAKEPLGPATHESGGFEWFDLVQWVGYGLIAAEEESITQNNVAQMASSSNLTVNQQRILGVGNAENGFAFNSKLANGKAWLQDVLRAVGNYGEIYERNLGSGGLGLERACTAQALWLTTDRSSWRDCDGNGTITQEENRGLMYAPRYSG